MKSKLILITLGAISCFNAFAQRTENPVTFGARLSMDVTMPDKAYKNGAGFSAGAVAQIALPRNFYFEPGIVVSYTGMTAKDLLSFDDYYYQNAARLWSLRVPFDFGYNFKVAPLWNVSVATGPYININLSAREQITPNLAAPVPVPDVKLNLFDNGWKRLDAGWGIKLGTTFADHYYIGISGGISITPLAKYGNKDKVIRIHKNTIAVTLGYNF